MFFFNKKNKFKFNLKEKNFFSFISLFPVALILITSQLLIKIRTMWMTPFYLFLGLFLIIFKQLI